MKHSSNRAFFAIWDEARGRSPAPERAALCPQKLGQMLSEAFVLSRDTTGSFSFRVAGSGLCTMAGRDLKGQEIVSLIDGSDRRDLSEIVAVTADELLPAVAGLSGADAAGGRFAIELLLLPFAQHAAHSASVTGAFATFDSPVIPLPPLQLTSWRHLHPPRLTSPRMIQRINLLRGLTVYEGLR